MRYTKPRYYDAFRCIAEKCPDSCCEGWQIVIDEDSLEKYQKVEGPFGNRLLGSVDWQEGVFRQRRGRCSFLNQEGLCDLQKELGEEYLCKTCSLYPRHVEEYEGLREWSLSLSCPVAAEMIVTDTEPFVLLEEETDEEEELAEEFEDFDLLLFSQLEEAREVLFKMLGKRSVSFEKRLSYCRQLVLAMQKCIDEERLYDVDDVIGHFEKLAEEMGLPCQEALIGYDRPETDYRRAVQWFEILEWLERLRPEWTHVLSEAQSALYDGGEEAYEELHRQFRKECADFLPALDRASENLMYFFLYTYFCGAVYDDWICSKFALAEFSVFWIRELLVAAWVKEGKVNEQMLITIAYRFAREIEHSDENLNALEEYLESF